MAAKVTASALWALRPRYLSTKLIVLGALVTFAITAYTFSSSEFTFRLSDWSSVFAGRQRSACSPEAWSSGYWTHSPNTDLSALTSPDQVFAFNGLEGCAADREYYWHLGVDHEELFDRFPAVASYKWQPSSQCDVRPLNGAAIVKDMVEQGGWLVLGDSITENHFFSLACLLYPHVRATPNYTENPYFDRAWPQKLYLSPTSPLIPELDFPPNFSIQDTPLVLFRRVDLLLNQEDLETLYHNTLRTEAEEEDPTTTNTTRKLLFKGNFGTLVVSTGGHWTTTLMSAFRDEEAGDEAGYGIDGVKAFFKVAMRTWAGQVQDAIDDYRRNGGIRPKQVVVRAYLPGHEDCHNRYEPWAAIQPYQFRWYNWPWIQDYNAIFEDLLSTREFPDIFYLPIDRPGRLRPDAHAGGDCLHILTGAGVLEGWSHYIWHFVTREIPGRIR
ncbi:hypothetical protein JVT61DRAFT_3175 [Boletus reticuloceps]|uniref:Uncharacterized protein n=1 Tax=Boletus reticuloceps TaxID=495285 RepID=A0A8I2YML3_9AGAM|nr:hypothetical protein JVT61DRAFT_3175 [Boletus reticuloceps]